MPRSMSGLVSLLLLAVTAWYHCCSQLWLLGITAAVSCDSLVLLLLSAVTAFVSLLLPTVYSSGFQPFVYLAPPQRRKLFCAPHWDVSELSFVNVYNIIKSFEVIMEHLNIFLLASFSKYSNCALVWHAPLAGLSPANRMNNTSNYDYVLVNFISCYA